MEEQQVSFVRCLLDLGRPNSPELIGWGGTVVPVDGGYVAR